MKATFELTDTPEEEARVAKLLAVEQGNDPDATINDICRRESRYALRLTPEQIAADRAAAIIAKLADLPREKLGDVADFIATKIPAKDEAADVVPAVRARP